MRGSRYSFDGEFNEMLSDQFRALDPSIDPMEFDIGEEGVVFDEISGIFVLEEDNGKSFEESHAGRTHAKKYEGKKIASQKAYRDLELLPLEIDYLKDELLEFKLALMSLLHQQEESQTEIEGIEKGVISPRTKGLIQVNQKFIEVTLRNQISNTFFRQEDAQRLQRDIEDSKKSSRIVDWMMTGKRLREDIEYSPFHMMSDYEGSMYYSSLIQR